MRSVVAGCRRQDADRVSFLHLAEARVCGIWLLSCGQRPSMAGSACGSDSPSGWYRTSNRLGSPDDLDAFNDRVTRPERVQIGAPVGAGFGGMRTSARRTSFGTHRTCLNPGSMIGGNHRSHCAISPATYAVREAGSGGRSGRHAATRPDGTRIDRVQPIHSAITVAGIVGYAHSNPGSAAQPGPRRTRPACARTSAAPPRPTRHAPGSADRGSNSDATPSSVSRFWRQPLPGFAVTHGP
jgi:hypothetical protein